MCAGRQVSALGALLERHRARLHAGAVSMLGHGPDAEDAVQDTLLIALRRIGELRDPAAAGGWLLARDFTDGVVAVPQRVIPGREVSVLELVLENPADQPLHCPPAVTQLHFHAAGRTHRLVSHYAPRPGSSRRTVPGARTGSLRGAP